MMPVDDAAGLAVLCFATVALVTFGAIFVGAEDRPLSQRWTGQPPKYYRRGGGYVRR